ncbi:aminoglycoside adenylyltransferase domain-containing protein [Lederbergia citrea]|uniref:DUF4111 domain-containing protein n=1 Tax=Lederbergia citrea TaxID=2833581 RepID=A0A942Z287_9BACI|nr:aminoglycoside adenylyltransferase domain-containing protein [Lederbergia citrea]MBS4203075.1 DUF4111 domain-containing protein [Lederbergia citrea]MBS4222253.1 DUF4111 domain-containing protein [Lederbergia citrea]
MTSKEKITFDGINPSPTRFSELNELLINLVISARNILGDNFFGAYLQGSFAVGDADMQSDCDFLIFINEQLTDYQENELRKLHDEIPTRQGHWTQHLEGSYPIASEFKTLKKLDAKWLYIDHGWREMQWDTHCNNCWARWSLREKGITLIGPDPKNIVDPIPKGIMRDEAKKLLINIIADTHSWMPPTIAWGQRYIVTTACRMLYTIKTGEVISKARCIDWAAKNLDSRWLYLLKQVKEDRKLGFDANATPREGSMQEAYSFVKYVQSIGLKKN